MTQNARIDGDTVSASQIPRIGRLSDGRTVSNYRALPDDVLYAEGWREVIDGGQPDHDPETQRVRRTLEAQGDEVRAVYTVEDRPPPPPEDTSDEDFRQAVEAATSIADLKAALLGEAGPGAEPRRGALRVRG